MTKVSRLFTESDLARIKDSVKEAEGHTSGEIVPYVVEMSDAYEIAQWRAAVLLGIVALGVFAAARQWMGLWLPLDFMEMAFVSMFAAAAGALLAHLVPAVQRLFTGKHLLDRHVHQRAFQAFLSEEVFATRDRTGILLFLSLHERRVLVLGDSGINAKVKPADWDGVVKRVITGVKEGRIAEGLIGGIRECGRLLEQHGVQRRPDDTDELSDDLRVEDR